jgi:hypothetical protein
LLRRDLEDRTAAKVERLLATDLTSVIDARAMRRFDPVILGMFFNHIITVCHRFRVPVAEGRRHHNELDQMLENSHQAVRRSQELIEQTEQLLKQSRMLIDPVIMSSARDS